MSRLEDAQKVFSMNLQFLRLQRLLIAKVGDAFRGGLASMHDVPEIAECVQSTDEVIASIDKLTATMTRAMDRVETICDESND